ncbi:MAG: endolytic transglycosylase MltG [Clostridium sp.]|uniref:Endolytic murein transglycosylase n=1 Tax=Clostridium paraputrificum TaxID=29363 RepID=A0A6N2YPN1_9CLOT|nr:endolytic transglycosylase MltG [Clostridium sp.]MBS5925744.1 endolytic transglycosylase MltG [Clostridium sp.]MBS5985563.1 endolytic transglycosylase MltG [Clostridium sp.]
MKSIHLKKIVLVIIGILLISIIGMFIAYNNVVKNPLKTDSDKITIEVKEGEGFYNLLDRLNSEGVIKNETLIKVNLKLTKQDLKIIPGSYEVDSDVTLKELIKMLTTEDFLKNQVKVTIKEGYTIDTIADVIAESGICTRDEFINEVKNYPLPDYVKVDSNKKYNLEGYLFPDTYFFDKNFDAKSMIKVMLDNFDKKLSKLEKETGKKINKDDIESIIIKASLVEKEARLDEERPIIASVINNRISKGMKLEFCSTVNYVIGYEGNEILSYNDLKVESPYNTYKNIGLPVGAVGSPGYNSIKAVLEPADTDYLYFVLLYGENGKHHFSTNYEEHERVNAEQNKKRGSASN